MLDFLYTIIGMTICAVAIPIENIIRKHFKKQISLVGLMLIFAGTGITLAQVPHQLIEEKLSLYYYFVATAFGIFTIWLHFFYARKDLKKEFKKAYYITFVQYNYVFGAAALY